MEITISTVHEDLVKLQRQIELLNKILLDEGRLSQWARKELDNSRSEKEESYSSLNDL